MARHAAAALRLGDEGCCPTEPGSLMPVITLESIGTLPEGTNGGQRALRLQEFSRCLVEYSLFLGQRQMHGAPIMTRLSEAGSLSSDGHRGTRSLCDGRLARPIRSQVGRVTDPKPRSDTC